MSKVVSQNNQISILKKQDILLIPITDFFSEPKNLDLLLGILITGKYKVSLRIIDWFVTNYAKKHNLVINRDGNRKPFIVFLEYKSQLKAYSKKQFDPFCRRSRIHYEYERGKRFETTIGQLNFFRWAIENQIVEYIMNNYDDIEKDMNNTLKTTKLDNMPTPKTPNSTDNSSFVTDGTVESLGSDEKSTGSGGKKKSTITATKSICKHNVKIVVSFD
jgi:hypothetical protein